MRPLRAARLALTGLSTILDSALIPFGYIFFLGLALLVGTLISASVEAIGQESIVFLGHNWSLGVVYGSLTSAIVVLLSFEIAATLLLLGAQVIAEYERLEKARDEGRGANE